MNQSSALSMWTTAIWIVTGVGLGCSRYGMDAVRNAEKAVDWATLAEIGVHDFEDDVPLKARRVVGSMLRKRQGLAGLEPLGPPIQAALSSDDSGKQKAGLDLLRRICMVYSMGRWGGKPEAGPVIEQPFWIELVPLAARVTILLGPEIEELDLWYLVAFYTAVRSEEVFVIVEATLKRLAVSLPDPVQRDASFLLRHVRGFRDEYRASWRQR